MSKRIQVWPPTGGLPIEIWESDKGRFLGNGWLESDPTAVVAPAAETATISDIEEIENGDDHWKRRNRKSRH